MVAGWADSQTDATAAEAGVVREGGRLLFVPSPDNSDMTCKNPTSSIPSLCDGRTWTAQFATMRLQAGRRSFFAIKIKLSAPSAAVAAEATFSTVLT